MVSTPLKNISQNGNLLQIGMKIKKSLKPPASYYDGGVSSWPSPKENANNKGLGGCSVGQFHLPAITFQGRKSCFSFREGHSFLGPKKSSKIGAYINDSTCEPGCQNCMLQNNFRAIDCQDVKTLEVNHHFKNGGSFWKMINLSIKNGGWTSREDVCLVLEILSSATDRH